MASPSQGVLLPKKVWNTQQTEYGTPTGGTRRCQMEGCSGLRIAVRWTDSSLTWPCTRGMSALSEEEMKIG
jgi:hypothetical protein